MQRTLLHKAGKNVTQVLGVVRHGLFTILYGCRAGEIEWRRMLSRYGLVCFKSSVNQDTLCHAQRYHRVSAIRVSYS